ncbi:unnamed protein product [Penicillium olsonii]|uniref:Actin cortical patch SUR7/pH-response regulator PalI n=1 Tax=Penicillium olsonii TaxID=99116 RepID=A0A9W4MLW7_PENOL|nr:unnamed protein product [Penicillium olsonii]CAG8020634.1 unnamed protein product [Penicillium olsonii]CAG8212479.1 unnamed protein product [Penicillium olsonii]
MLKPKRIFPTVTVFIAFIITILCLFAGTQKNFLENVDLLTLYTPEGSTDSTAHDFYSVHIMSYCQGTLGASDPGARVTRNVTECSHRKILFSFDPTQEWPVTHDENLEWPRVISDDFHAFRMTTRSMAVLYSIGVGAMGAALLVKLWTAVAPRAGQGLFECGFMVLGSLCVNVASIIATVLAFEFVDLINAHGKGSNVSAKYGEKLLGMTWAAAGLLLVGSAVCLINTFRPAAPIEKAVDDMEG